MASDLPAPEHPHAARPHARRTHWLAALALVAAGLANGGAGLVSDRMPLGDFPGYAAQVQAVRDDLRAYGRVPRWCSACYGGTTRFTSQLKERLAFPLAVVADPVLATKLLTLILRVAAGLCLYALVVWLFGAPWPGLIAGYAYAFGAFPNHQVAHLDMALAAAVLPLITLAAIAALARGGAGWLLLLGAGVAVQLSNNWVYAFPLPLLVLLLVVLQPWAAAAERGWPRERLLRWLGRGVAALSLCAAFAASPVAWILADAGHHRLAPAATIDQLRDVYIEHSPFLFVNRENALAGWLSRHQPPGYDLPGWDGGRRYLGAVALAVCVVALPLLRREPRLRALAALATAMFVFQYWLALGPRTLLWQVAQSLHASPALEAAAAQALRLLAVACVFVAGWKGLAASQRSTQRGVAAGQGVGRWLGLALLAFFPTAALWPVLARALPLLERQRSPGHFFDTAWFWFALLLAVALVALARRIRPAHVGRGVLAGVALGLVLDYAPSAARHAEGAPLPALRSAASRLASLPGEAGTLRIALPPGYSPIGSWLAAQSPAGHAWGWVPWQAGRHWDALYTFAAWRRGAAPDARALAPDAALLASARIGYYLLGGSDTGGPGLPAPWRRLAADETVSVWALPEVAPLAAGYHAFVLAADADASAAVSWVAPALRQNVLLVHETAGIPGDPVLRERARAIVHTPYGVDAPAEASIASPPWLTALRADPAPPPFAAVVSRPSPEHLQLTLEPPVGHGMVLVREGYHPWWRAHVDGAPAPVVRAHVAFLAVPVPPGARDVALRFVPPALVAVADRTTQIAWIAFGLAAPLLGIRHLRRVQRRAGGAPASDQSSNSASPLR